ncbi:MAG: glycine cleavage T C-terminal barrel domain-containing protein, partial [Anaerolineales bacterium]
PVLLRLGENHFWVALADSDILLWAKGVARGAGMRVELREPDVSPLQVQGPKSKEVVRALFGERVDGLAYYHFFETELDGIPLVVTRTGWTGEVGYELYLRDGSRGVELWDRVLAAGKRFQIRPTGPSDIRRIEAGMLNFGADMTPAENPYEVGLARLVDKDKTSDYIGKQALARLRAQGVRLRLVGVEIEGGRIPFNMVRWTVRQGDAPIGAVTSAIHSPRLKKNIGYAMVPLAASELGTSLTVEIPEMGERRATVVARPFIDPEKDIPKS